jgi:ribonuclease P protein component
MSLVFCAGKYKTIKVGFSASKKVGNSVVRHRALRLMREAVKPHLDKMALNHSYIFIAKEGIEKKHLSELTRAMEHLLKRASLIKN